MYISSKSFSEACDLVICPLYTDKLTTPPETPKRIFITGEYGTFHRFLYILQSFKQPYELVYHRTDRTFDRHDFESIRNYVSRIYAENCEIKHEKITQLPLGFPDDRLPTRLSIDKDILCYLNVGLPNDQELKFVQYRSIRQQCIEHFKNKSWCTLEDNIPFDSFNERMNRSKFVVCPMGFGIDTHRFYEAAWLGCTPIVITSGLDDLYKKFGALIVDSWDEVTEELLSRHEKVEVPDSLFKVEDYITHSPLTC